MHRLMTVLCGGLWLTACAGASVTVGGRPSPALERMFGPETPLAVTVAGGSQQCASDGEAMRVQLLADAQAVLALQAARGLRLVRGDEAPLDVPHALLELGTRPTGGYGLAVSQDSTRRGNTAILRITLFEPAPGRMVTQQLTSPCVLVRLPAGEWTALRVMDQSGVLRALYPEPTE